MSAFTHSGRLSIIAMISLCTFSSVFAYSGGSGEPNNPYQISAVTDWQDLMNTSTDWGGYFIMTADVNLSGVALRPIGNSATKFTGILDGNGHIISNAVINQQSSLYVGLFGYLDGGQIKNLGVENADMTGSLFVGGLVGYSHSGTISNCHSTGSVSSSLLSSSSYTGGLIGCLNSGTIANCYSTGSISSSSSLSAPDSSAGGLVGYINSGTIANSYSTGSISSSSYSSSYAGGLTGHLYSGVISNSYSTGSVSSFSSSINSFDTSSAGGLAGYIDFGTILNCYSTGSVSSIAPSIPAYAGGLVGDNLSGTVTASFWDIETSGQETSAGGTGMLTAEMKTLSNFTLAGWDFLDEIENGYLDIWRMCVDGQNYPKLSWEFKTGDFGCPDGVDIYDLAVFVDQWLLENLSYDIAPAGGDGIVDFLDWAVFANNWQGDMTQLSEFASEWLQPSAYSADIAPAPDGDGIVNMLDFAAFAENWLAEEN